MLLCRETREKTFPTNMNLLKHCAWAVTLLVALVVLCSVALHTSSGYSGGDTSVESEQPNDLLADEPVLTDLSNGAVSELPLKSDLNKEDISSPSLSSSSSSSSELEISQSADNVSIHSYESPSAANEVLLPITSFGHMRHSRHHDNGNRRHGGGGSGRGKQRSGRAFTSEEFTATSDEDDEDLDAKDALSLSESTAPMRNHPSGWSRWTRWSTCTRTCGGGIQKALRKCASPSGCRGKTVKHRLCNTQPCEEEVDFRAAQCGAYNEEPYRGNLYEWVPFRDPQSPCALACVARGFNFVKTWSDKVVDGTHCGDGALAVCVKGKCIPVGCDLKLGSNKRVDACGICGGSGAPCSSATSPEAIRSRKSGDADEMVASNFVNDEAPKSISLRGSRDTTPKTMEDLKKEITKEIQTATKKMVERTLNNWLRRLQVCMNQKGTIHSENLVN